MVGRGLVIAVVVAASTAVAAPVAQAATTRYAAPAAQGTGDCSTAANACPIATAVTTAASGDTIDVLANLGDFNLGAGTIAPGSSKALHLVGINGTPRLIGSAAGATLQLEAASSSATNLYLENDGSGDALVAGAFGAPGSFSLDRLFAKTTATPSHTCLIEGGTLTNSVCWQANSTAGTDSIALEGTNTLRNDVGWESGSGAGVDCLAAYFDCTSTVVNTIARATGTGGSDMEAFSTSFSVTLTVRYSNFGATASKGTAANDHFDTDATDQNTPPRLVNASAGDFHELAASPTIDAGITDPANGAADLDGRPRSVNGKTDIGAYELGTPGTALPSAPAPSPLGVALARPHGTRITKTRVGKQRVVFRFTALGTVRGFRCALVRQKKRKHHKKPKPVFRRCRSPKTYKHLKHGRYTFEVRAFNSAGVDPKLAITRFTV